MTTTRLRTWGAFMAKRVAPTLALVALAATLAFQFWPGLKPDPATRLAASLKITKIEPGVKFGAYLQRTHQKVNALGAADRDVRGHLLFVKVKIEGRAHGSLTLKQAVHDARTERPLPGQDATVDSTLTLETPDDEWVQPVFIADTTAVPVFARLTVYDEDVLLALTDSKTLD